MQTIDYSLTGFDWFWQALTEFDRFRLNLTGFDWFWSVLTDFDRLWLNLTGLDWIWQCIDKNWVLNFGEFDMLWVNLTIFNKFDWILQFLPNLRGFFYQILQFLTSLDWLYQDLTDFNKFELNLTNVFTKVDSFEFDWTL